jgi:phage terminase large subunit
MAKAEPVQYNYTPREAFVPLHARRNRWGAVIAHRRAGKSTALINELVIRGLHARDDGLRQQFAYMCPFQNQARSVAWQVLKDYTAGCPGYKISEMNLTVTLPHPKDLNKPGATIMLLGAENAERLRGIFLDGVVMDEFQDIPVYVWDTIIRPALADRQGFAVFSGTVKGRNNALWELYEKACLPDSGWFEMLVKASESGILPAEELEDLKRNMTDEAYAAEMECNPDAIVTGRIFLQHLQRKQITKVPWQPDGGPVFTGWDLGMSDTTSIWVAQAVGKEVHLLDFYEQSGQGLDHYVNWLRTRDYAKYFGTHLMPHDTNVRELGTGVSRLQTLRSMGMRNVKVVPKLPKGEQIDAARMLLPRCWFDGVGCREGVKSLENYSYNYDPKRQCFSQTPLHDRWSNGCLVAGTLIKTTKGDVPIELVQVGDTVITPSGPGLVENAGPTKWAEELITIDLANGVSLCCTPEHKIFTRRGFLLASEVVLGDTILTGKSWLWRLFRDGARKWFLRLYAWSAGR